MLVGNTGQKLAGLFAWDDAKGTWTPLATNGVFTPNPRGIFGDQTAYDLAIAVDPRNANRVYIAGTRGYRSDDGGASFVMMGEENHSDWHVIVTAPSNPDVIYAGTDGGISVSTDIGASWTSRSSGLSIAQFYGGISATRDGSKIMGGSQDNGTFIYNGSGVWNSINGGDGGYTAINYKTPSVVYSATPNGGIWRNDPTDPHGKFIKPPLLASERTAFISPFVMDPVDPKVLYFGSNRFWGTPDEGTTWVALSDDMSLGEAG